MKPPAAAQWRVDLNADVGEGWPDGEILPFVTSANVACGAHAGDDATMRATLALARRHAVVAGAHPGFPDREGFGRRVTTRDPGAIERLVAAQVAALAAIAGEAGVALAHVKPHGALYNLSAVDAGVARTVARAVRAVLPDARLVGLAGSCSLVAAREVGLVALAEAFVDRGYRADGTLAARGTPGALLDDPEAAALRAVALARGEPIATVDGSAIVVPCDTLCLHGDVPDAAATARAVRRALEAAGVAVAPPV